MANIQNPAWQNFLGQLHEEFVLAQVLIRRAPNGFELRHVADANVDAAKLRIVAFEEIRALIDHAANGAFRPLKSSPNLIVGWRLVLADESSLELALNQFYPNAIADWFWVQKGNPPVTNYREFTARQTGMYRIAAMLTDAQAEPMVRACCHGKFCLKTRLWSVENLKTDLPAEKSALFCLEPCALLLEFARKAMRLEQEREATEINSSLDAEAIEKRIEEILKSPTAIRDADFNQPENPRRLQLELEKLAQRSS